MYPWSCRSVSLAGDSQGRQGWKQPMRRSPTQHCPMELWGKFWDAVSPMEGICVGIRWRHMGRMIIFFLNSSSSIQIGHYTSQYFPLPLFIFSRNYHQSSLGHWFCLWLRKLRDGSVYPLPLQPALKFHASQVLKHIFSITLQPWEKLTG